MNKKSEQNVGATKHVTVWGKPQPDDYDFRSWEQNASRHFLEAGCIYEYARESSKLRGLLVQMAEARKHRDHAGSSFDGLEQDDVRDTFGNALSWLRGLAGQLSENQSFAELVRTSEVDIKQSLTERPIRPPLRAIHLAHSVPWESDPPWPWRPWSSSMIQRLIGNDRTLPERHIREDGSECVAIEIHWGKFSDSEIATQMKKFAGVYRPKNQNCKERTRRGQRPEVTIRSRLKALSVMRIWRREPDPWKRLGLVGTVCGYKSCRSEAAAYKKRCKEGRGDEPMSNAAKATMSEARTEALEFFQRLLPGEQPDNYEYQTQKKR